MRDGKDKMNKKKKKQNGPMEATSGHPYMAMTSHKMVDMGKEAQQQMGETSVKTPLLPSPRKGSGNQSSGDSMLPSAKQQGGVRKEGITVVLSGCSREVEYHSRNVNQGWTLLLSALQNLLYKIDHQYVSNFVLTWT